MTKWKLGLIALGAGLAIGAVAGVVYYFAFERGNAQVLALAEADYDQGAKAFDNRDAEAALARFQEAMLQANQVLDDIAGQRESAQERSAEQDQELERLEGQAYWLKSRALHGQALAQMLAEGKRLPPSSEGLTDDSVTLDQIPLTRIPDDTTRTQAIICLRQAALRLPKHLDVQKAAVNLEIQMEPMHWQLAPRFAMNVLEQDEDDARARFLMARYEFEQPLPVPGNPRGVPVAAPLHRRTPGRVMKALAHVNKLKEVEAAKVRWRTLCLEARIHDWLLSYYRSPQSPKMPAQEIQHEAALRTVLFDPVTGVRKRAEQEERLAKLSRLDLEGLLHLHTLALDVALGDLRHAKPDDKRQHLDRVTETLDATLAVCQRMAALDEVTPARLTELADTAVLAVAMTQPFLAKDQTQSWRTYVDSVQGLARRAVDRNAGSPALFVNLTELLAQEAEIAGKQGQSAQAAQLREQTLQWIETGLRVAEQRKFPQPRMLSLHEQAARIKAAAAGQREDIAPHLKVLLASNVAEARATALLLDGMLAERDGRLERARVNLETVLAIATGPTALRAHMILANVYLGLGIPDRALASLQQVQAAYAKLDQLSDEERSWAKEFIRTENDLNLMLIQAHLQTAQLKYREVCRQSPDGRAAIDESSGTPAAPARPSRPTVTARPTLVAEAARPTQRRPNAYPYLAPHEKEAKELTAKFVQPSPMNRVARQLYVDYLVQTDRAPQAQERLLALRQDYPDSVQVLRQEIATIAATQPAESRTKSESILRQFMSEFPQEAAAKLLYAEWLTSTGRPIEAVSFLADPANLPGLADEERVDRLRALAYLKAGDRDKALEAVQLLPRDPAADILRIRLVGSSAAEMQKLVRDELPRYEGNALLACFNANLSHLKGDQVDAARGFLQCLEYTRLRPIARQGLLSSLFAMAQDNPEKALTLLAGELLQEYPGEPELLMAYAYASLLLDRVGNPKEASDRPKDMVSALNIMEQAFVVQRDDRITGPLIKAQFWKMAERSDLARGEVLRALQQDFSNERALLLGARLALESSDPVDLAAGRKYIEALREKYPSQPEAYHLEGQLLEREGKSVDAIKAYTTLIDKFPTYDRAYAALVELLEKRGQRDAAAQWVEVWRSRRPNDPSPIAAQVRQLASAGKLVEARQAADRFLADQVKLAEERAAKMRPAVATDAVEMQRRRQAMVDAFAADLQLQLAEAFLRGRAFPDAEARARQVLQKSPESEAANLLLGHIFMERLQADPKSPERTAWAHQARKAYEVVYANRKGHPIAGNNLAWLLAREERYEDALRIAREVRTGRYSRQPLPGDRLSADFLDTLGVVYTGLSQPEYLTEMRDLFETARQRYPHDPRIYLHLGRAYAALQDKSKAQQMFATAISLANQPAHSPLSDAERTAVLDAAREAQQRLKGN